MKHFTFESTRTSHYFVQGNLDSAEHLWIVLHGMSQLADDFLKPFQVLDEKHAIVSLEAHARYYTDSKYENVGASWMTNRFREEEIVDQSVMLNRLYQRVVLSHHKVHVLGFSQGVATGMRWVMQEKPPIHTMIMWAGWPPELLMSEEDEEYLTKLYNVYVYGAQDKFINEERIEKFNQRKDLEKIDFHKIVFEGGHRLSRKVILQIASYLGRQVSL